MFFYLKFLNGFSFTLNVIITLVNGHKITITEKLFSPTHEGANKTA